MRRPRHTRRTLPEIAVRQRFHTVRGYSREVSRARLRLLDDVEVRRLRAEEFTYSEVGETTGVTYRLSTRPPADATGQRP